MWPLENPWKRRTLAPRTTLYINPSLNWRLFFTRELRLLLHRFFFSSDHAISIPQHRLLLLRRPNPSSLPPSLPLASLSCFSGSLRWPRFIICRSRSQSWSLLRCRSVSDRGCTLWVPLGCFPRVSRLWGGGSVWFLSGSWDRALWGDFFWPLLTFIRILAHICFDFLPFVIEIGGMALWERRSGDELDFSIGCFGQWSLRVDE